MDNRTWGELSAAEQRELLDSTGATHAIQNAIGVWREQSATVLAAMAKLAQAVDAASEILRDMGTDPEKDFSHWSFEDVFALASMARDARSKYGAEIRISFPKKRKRGPKPKLTDKDIDRLIAYMDQNPHKDMTTIAELHGITYGTLYNYLKKR